MLAIASVLETNFIEQEPPALKQGKGMKLLTFDLGAFETKTIVLDVTQVQFAITASREM